LSHFRHFPLPAPNAVQLPQPMPFDEALRRALKVKPEPKKARKRRNTKKTSISGGAAHLLRARIPAVLLRDSTIRKNVEDICRIPSSL